MIRHINDVTVPYDREGKEKENTIHENMIEADAVTNDLQKKLQLPGERSLNV